VEPLVSWFMRATWWARKWVVLLRERQLRVQAAAELVAGELAANAAIVGKPHYSQDLSTWLDLHLDAWMQYRSDLYPISKRDRELWDAVQEAYANLQRVATHGGEPLEPHALDALASRLRSTRF
jgi:hypothetical protein